MQLSFLRDGERWFLELGKLKKPSPKSTSASSTKGGSGPF
jgi:hypothetical protein